MIIAAQPTVEVVTAGTDWPAIVAAIVTGLVAIIGIGGTAWQAKRGREAATADLNASLTAATTNQNANIKAAAENTARTLDAALGERIWERRARAYEQSIGALLYRQYRRREDQAQLNGPPRPPAAWQERLSLERSHLFSHLFAENVSAPERPFFDRYPGGWFEVEGALLAYATPKVITALNAAREADDAARNALADCWQLLPERDFVVRVLPEDSDASPEEAPTPDANAQAKLEKAAKALESAFEEADRKDDDLINAIRGELDAKPSQPN
jgi:hypothetical protein